MPMNALMLTAALLAPAGPATPEATVRAMFAAFNSHDPKAMARRYAPHARLTSSDFCSARGRADVERTYAALFQEMPDIQDSIDSIVTQHDTVAVRFTASSAKAGFTLRIAAFLTVRDGLIVEDDSVFDNGGRPCSE